MTGQPPPGGPPPSQPPQQVRYINVQRPAPLEEPHMRSSFMSTEFVALSGGILLILALVCGGVYKGKQDLIDQGVELAKWVLGPYMIGRSLVKAASGFKDDRKRDAD